MNPESYQKIKQILIGSHNLSGTDKQNYINQACESHPELASTIKDILNKDASDAEVFEQSVVVNYNNKCEETLQKLDEKITDYKIVKKIGSGGMGDVYQADQTTPIERQVALKLLKDLPNQQLLMSEMQILAQLNHPNIATLYDVDKTTDERMFLVMELIEGEDIITWCDNHQFSVVKKVKLFQQLCAGISFAHEKGIIHCDIKPANIQITQVNDKPILKIIDFGISQLFKKSINQSYKILSGTPAYLSPEVLQAKGKTLADTRRDVYALGVLLHKLIVGRLPDSDNHDENKKVAKDLTAIINKAKAHGLSDRYANANNLNQDLERLLNQLPVYARERNFSYVLTRFIQRRFGVVIFSLILLTALIGGFVAQSIQAKRAKQQAKIAIEQRAVAEMAQQQAEELTDFLMGLFNLSNPERSNQKQSSTDDLVNKANKDLLAIANPTLSDASFMYTIGSIYLRMDQLKKAQISLEKSLDIRKKSLPKNDPNIIENTIQIGVVFMRLGENNKANKVFTQSLVLLNSQKQVDLSQLGFVYNHLGNLFLQTKQASKAVLQHQKALNTRLKLSDKKQIADSYNNLGAIYLENNQWDLSQENLEKALELYQEQYHEDHPYIAHALQNLAVIAESKYQWNKAQELHTKSYANILKIYGKKHAKTILTQVNLSVFYSKIEQYTKSIELKKELIETYLALKNHHQVINQSRWLAQVYQRSGDLELSIQQYHYTLTQINKTESKGQIIEAKIKIEMAQAYRIQKSYNKALEVLQQSDIILQSNDGGVHYYNLIRLNTRAKIYRDLNKTDLAIATFNQIIDLFDSDSSTNQKEVINAYLGLGETTGSFDYYKKALNLSEKILPHKHKINAQIFYNMALFEGANNNMEKAIYYINKAIAIQKLILPKNHSELSKYKAVLKSLNP